MDGLGPSSLGLGKLRYCNTKVQDNGEKQEGKETIGERKPNEKENEDQGKKIKREVMVESEPVENKTSGDKKVRIPTDSILEKILENRDFMPVRSAEGGGDKSYIKKENVDSRMVDTKRGCMDVKASLYRSPASGRMIGKSTQCAAAGEGQTRPGRACAEEPDNRAHSHQEKQTPESEGKTQIGKTKLASRAQGCSSQRSPCGDSDDESVEAGLFMLCEKHPGPEEEEQFEAEAHAIDWPRRNKDKNLAKCQKRKLSETSVKDAVAPETEVKRECSDSTRILPPKQDGMSPKEPPHHSETSQRSTVTESSTASSGEQSQSESDGTTGILLIDTFGVPYTLYRKVTPQGGNSEGKEEAASDGSATSDGAVTCSSSPAKSYICAVCYRPFPYLSYLERHRISHLEMKPHVCSDCGKAFKRSSHLARHRHVHSDLGKPYQCSVCQKGFREAGELVQHERVHTGERPYQCQVCRLRFSERTTLRRHFQRKHAQQPLTPDP
ncbi:zinc finger protein 514-like [Polypterus senegalus]